MWKALSPLPLPLCLSLIVFLVAYHAHVEVLCVLNLVWIKEMTIHTCSLVVIIPDCTQFLNVCGANLCLFIVLK